MTFKLISFIYLFSFLLTIQASSSCALLSSPDFNPPYPKAISDLKEAIVKGLGLRADDFKVYRFNLRVVQVGHSLAYEINVEIDKKVPPFKLLEDVNCWEYVDLPIFRVEEPGRPNGATTRKTSFCDQFIATNRLN